MTFQIRSTYTWAERLTVEPSVHGSKADNRLQSFIPRLAKDDTRVR